MKNERAACSSRPPELWGLSWRTMVGRWSVGLTLVSERNQASAHCGAGWNMDSGGASRRVATQLSRRVGAGPLGPRYGPHRGVGAQEPRTQHPRTRPAASPHPRPLCAYKMEPFEQLEGSTHETGTPTRALYGERPHSAQEPDRGRTPCHLPREGHTHWSLTAEGNEGR